MMVKKILLFVLCLSFILLSFASCKKEEDKVQAKSYYEYFDTVSTVLSYKDESEAEFIKNCKAVADILGEYHKLLDIYYEYSGVNNLKTVNKNAGIAPVEVDDKLIDFLLYSKAMYTLTNSKTNIAMGAVLKLWHECRTDASSDPKNAKIPNIEELEDAALHCDINNLIIDTEANTVYISDPKMQLDVGAIGKGYATERAAELLMEEGVTSYVLNIGGNIRAIGTKPNGDGWDTGITHPDKNSDESFITKVNIKNTSLVTSGDYERFYTVEGVRYHHIIDPETLMPATYFSSISVFTEDGGLADALSTALFCMSYEDGLALVSSLDGVEVIWVDKDYKIKSTPGVKMFE
jgi:thiamine biosynthesis lipoprotein